MAPWLMMNLIVSPISQLPVVIGKIKSFFLVGFIGSISLIGFLSSPSFVNGITFEELLQYINWSQFFFLLIVMFWFIRISKYQYNFVKK
jgi:ABC-type Na+ efflux pump permease subunit